MAITPVEKRVTEFVENLRESNKNEELKGAPKIPEQEYENLKNILIKKVIRKSR
jgi:hypothetical protein